MDRAGTFAQLFDVFFCPSYHLQQYYFFCCVSSNSCKLKAVNQTAHSFSSVSGWEFAESRVTALFWKLLRFKYKPNNILAFLVREQKSWNNMLTCRKTFQNGEIDIYTFECSDFYSRRTIWSFEKLFHLWSRRVQDFVHRNGWLSWSFTKPTNACFATLTAR